MPERKKHQVHPVHPNDVVCDTCPARSPWMNTEAATWEGARILGWRLFHGTSVAGSPLTRRICPTCWNSGAPAPAPKKAPIVGQLDLPGLITPLPVAKKKATKNRRQMS